MSIGFDKPKVIKISFTRIVTRLAGDLDLDEYTTGYILKRLRAEGVPFLTKTLPKLSKSVLLGTEEGWFNRPTDFAWKGRSLHVFGSLLGEIFDEKGLLRKDPNPSAIRRVRQMCEYLYKLALSFSSGDLIKAAAKYVSHEDQLAVNESTLDANWVERLRKNLETHYPDVARLTAPDILAANRPRYTPGAFYGSETKVTKVCNGVVRDIPFYVRKQLPFSHRLPGVPLDFRHWSGYFKSYPSSDETITTETSRNRTCKVLFVPKDSRGPRIISKEPLNELRAQMSFFDTISTVLQRITGGRIQFTDQGQNQNLALRGSIDRSLATADLKDASDSVLYKLCRLIFRNCPGIRYFISRLRCTHASVDRQNVRLRKLSGMGSGFTFPVMALLIHLSVCSRISLRTNTAFCEVMPKVYVYGDDLIVPREWYSYAIEGLELSKLSVNRDKSYAHGHFRESCGKDYYRGVDVTIARLRLANADLPSSNEIGKRQFVVVRSVEGILQLERHCRELVDFGLTSLADYFYGRIERVLGTLPYVSRRSFVMGRYLYGRFVTERYEHAYVPVPVKENWTDVICPIKHLGRTLAPSVHRDTDFTDLLYPDTGQSRFGVLSRPREVNLVRKLVGLEKCASTDSY